MGDVLTLHPDTVDATGVHRRLQALMYKGHSTVRLAGRLGVSQQRIFQYLAATRLTPAVHWAITALYDELWNTPPDETTRGGKVAATRARNTARARGWVPPGAYDEDDMDNPEATPVPGWQRRAQSLAADLLPDAAELICWGIPPRVIEVRLRITWKSLEKARSRIQLTWAQIHAADKADNWPGILAAPDGQAADDDVAVAA
jgi:hypothetical protein